MDVMMARNRIRKVTPPIPTVLMEEISTELIRSGAVGRVSESSRGHAGVVHDRDGKAHDGCAEQFSPTHGFGLGSQIERQIQGR